ncbi:hypothetical protein GCM10022631_21680 [Deinococcus rubellus]
MALTLSLCSGLVMPASAQGGPGQDLANGPSTSSDTCFSGESLLVQLMIGGTDRGVQVVYLTPDQQLWLPLSALTVSERNYGGAVEVCEGERYVPLRPEVVRKLDRLGLTLNVAANFDVLGSSMQLLQIQPLTRTSNIGLWQLGYSLAADGNLKSNQFNEQGELNAQYLRGPLSTQFGYRQLYSGTTFSQRLNARAAWQFSPQFSAGVFGRTGIAAQPAALGVQADYARLLPNEVPPITLELPADSDIEVLLDGRTVQAFQAPAGQLTLRGLQPQTLQGEVEVRYRVGSQTQTQRFAYQLPNLNRAGSFSISGATGWQQGDGLTAVVNANLLITPQFTAQLAGELVGTRRHLNVAAYYTTLQHTSPTLNPLKSGPTSLSQTASISADLSTLENNQLNGVYTARYSLAGDRAQAAIYGTYTQSPDFQQHNEQTALGLDGSWVLSPQIALLGKAEYRLSGTIAGQAAVQWQTERASATLSSEFSSTGRLRFGLQARYRLDNVSSLSASAAVGAPQTAGAAPDYTATLDYNRAIGPDRLSLRYSAPSELSAAYEFNRGVQGGVAASTNGTVAARISGSLIAVGGQISSASDQTGVAALLLRTGIGDVPISLNGVVRGLTNPQGDLVLTGLNLQTPLDVRVNEDDLPIEISYHQASLSLNLSQVGVSVYDWRGNFTRSRFVPVRWSATELAAYSTLELPGGQQLYADEAGQILLPPVGEVTAVLRSEDGKRRCTVALNDTAKDFTCTP